MRDEERDMRARERGMEDESGVIPSLISHPPSLIPFMQSRV